MRKIKVGLYFFNHNFPKKALQTEKKPGFWQKLFYAVGDMECLAPLVKRAPRLEKPKTPCIFFSQKLRQIPQQFLSYLVFAGLAAFVNFSSRLLLSMLPGMPFFVAVAYLLGMCVNFVLSKLFVFASARSGRTKREAVKFFFVAIIGLLVTVAVSELALYLVLLAGGDDFFGRWSKSPHQLSETLAHIVGMGTGLVSNFLGHRFLSFRQTGLLDFFTEKIGTPKNEQK